MNNRKVSIIILTWNGLDYTKKCLDSLRSSAVKFGCEVYVADNGSSDGTLEYLSGLDWIHVIDNKENLGFVRGNNKVLSGIEQGDIVLLNNDMIICQEDWLEELWKTAYEKDENGVVGCRLVNEKGELLHAGTYIMPDTYWGQQIGGGQKDIGQYGADREVEGVVFACAYIKRTVIDKIGGLNEAFFSYFEDTDYCLRAQKAGFKVVCCGKVTLIHYQNVSTNINKTDFSKMFLTSQKTFKGIWGKELDNKYKIGMAWHSLVEGKSGYAVSAKNFMLALDKQGVDVRYRYVYGRNTPVPYKESGVSDDYRINVIRKRKMKKGYPQVVYGVADVFHKNDGRYKIGYTMLETTGIPDSWVKECNRMDEIWVPSTFNVKTFRDSGVRVPIYVMPLGVDTGYYNPDVVSYKKHDKYTFLSVFEWGERKAPEILLKAYSRAFKGTDEVVLVCKVNNNDSSVHVENEIRKLGLPEDGPEIVFIYNTEFDDYQMPTLYRSADCFVTATRGEGWGMPILEAMACGLPAIATDWSAQMDFLNENTGFPVEVEKLVDAHAKCTYYEGFQWAQVKEEHLIQRMRYVYEHREEAVRMGQRACEYVQKEFTWDRSAEKMVKRLLEINQ